MAPNEVIEATSFAIFPHSGGPILSVLTNRAVVANIKLDTGLIWLLDRLLNEALREQYAFEQRMKSKQDGGQEKVSNGRGEQTAWGHRTQAQQIRNKPPVAKTGGGSSNDPPMTQTQPHPDP